MTYPKVSTNDDADRQRPARRPVQPALPRDRGAGPEVLGRGRHLPRVGREPRGRRGRRRTSSSSTTGRPSPTACRTTATCSPATSRTSSRATRRCAARRVERRFGWDTHGLPAELEAMSQLGIKTKEEILELGIDDVQRQVPRVGAEVHRRVARLRHPPGALGRLRQRLQDARARLHGVGDLGVQAALRQGPGLRGLPRAALLLERPDAAVQPRAADGRRRLQDTARTRRSPSACASRPASWPWSGRRRRGPCRPTSRSWSAPTSTTSSSSPTSPGTTERYVIGEARLAAYAKDLFGDGDDPRERVVERLKGADLRRPRATRRRSPTTWATRSAHRRLRRPTSSPPRTAPGSSTRRRLR